MVRDDLELGGGGRTVVMTVALVRASKYCSYVRGDRTSKVMSKDVDFAALVLVNERCWKIKATGRPVIGLRGKLSGGPVIPSDRLAARQVCR